MSDSRAIGGGLVMGCAVGANVANIGAVATEMGDAYGVSLTVVGLFTTALFVTHTAVMIPGGQAIDRFGARRLGFLALLVILAGNAAAMIASDPALVVPARAFTGIGTGVGFIAASDYVRTAGGSAFAQGLFGGVATAGGALSLAAVPPLERWIGWRAPFALMVALALVALAALILAPLRQSNRAAGQGRRVTALQVLGDRRLYGFAVMQAAAFGLSVVAGNWVATLLEHHGYSTWLASALGAVTLALSVFSRPFGGWIERHHPERARAAVAVSLAIGAAACIGLAASGPVALALISVVALGIAAGDPVCGGVRRRSARSSRRAGRCHRPRQHGRWRDDPRRHATRRPDLRPPRRRAHRLRRDGRAVGSVAALAAGIRATRGDAGCAGRRPPARRGRMTRA